MKRNPILAVADALEECATALRADIETNPLCDTKDEILKFAGEHWPELMVSLTYHLSKEIQKAFPDLTMADFRKAGMFMDKENE